MDWDKVGSSERVDANCGRDSGSLQARAAGVPGWQTVPKGNYYDVATRPVVCFLKVPGPLLKHARVKGVGRSTAKRGGTDSRGQQRGRRAGDSDLDGWEEKAAQRE